MWRHVPTVQALGCGMNFIAARTLSTGIEGVPRVVALTGPDIGRGGFPVALGAGDTRDGS